MIKRKHFAMSTVICIDCREEYSRDVTDIGPQLCPDCKDYYGCCECGQVAPLVDIIYDKQTDLFWCAGCAEKSQERFDKHEEE